MSFTTKREMNRAVPARHKNARAADSSVPLDRHVGDPVGGDVTRILLRGGPVDRARCVGRTEPLDDGVGELGDRAALDSGERLCICILHPWYIPMMCLFPPT